MQDDEANEPMGNSRNCGAERHLLLSVFVVRLTSRMEGSMGSGPRLLSNVRYPSPDVRATKTRSASITAVSLGRVRAHLGC